MQSTAALPFGTICIILVIWALITFPLTVLGGIAGKNSKVRSILSYLTTHPETKMKGKAVAVSARSQCVRCAGRLQRACEDNKVPERDPASALVQKGACADADGWLSALLSHLH